MKRWLAANRGVLFAILSYLDTPISLAIWLRIKFGEWDSLATHWVDPHHYPEGVFNALRYRRDVQASDLLRKAPLPTTLNRRTAALTAWDDAERQCYLYNEYLAHLDSPRLTETESRLRDLLALVQKRMGRWLGPLPEDLEGGFGPGTCLEYVGKNPTVVDKIGLTPTTTPRAAEIFSLLYHRTLWGHRKLVKGQPLPDISRGNRLTTVPKDGKVDRPISIEPLGNLWLQLGVGRYLKRRLRQIGLPRFEGTERELIPGLTCSYPDAQSVHRLLASNGHRSGYATIDLSSASDTISKELVRRVIPPDWFELMDAIRSPMTFVPYEGLKKGWHLLEKFSSMGNGFTFELETMIFLGLLSVAFGLTPGVDIWVFGDDIIVPCRVASDACYLLESVGFKVNRRKSYLSGPFRESCGGNFHSGLDTNPVRIKGPLEEIPEVVAFHNALRRWGFPTSVTGLVAQQVPLKYRIFGPEKLEDRVLHGKHSRPRCEDGIWKQKCLKFKPSHQIDIDRWPADDALTALSLGVPPRLVRRGTHVLPTVKWASVS